MELTFANFRFMLFNMNTEEKKVEEAQAELSETKKEIKKERKRLAALKKSGGGLLKDFKDFISKGNVLNLAVAFIMGVAFTAIVTSLVNDIIMPFISIIFGKTDIGGLKWVVSPDLTIHYGQFILAVVNFLLVALVLFFIIKIATSAGKGYKKIKKGQPVPPPPPPADTTESLLKDILKVLKENNKEKKKSDD